MGIRALMSAYAFSRGFNSSPFVNRSSGGFNLNSVVAQKLSSSTSSARASSVSSKLLSESRSRGLSGAERLVKESQKRSLQNENMERNAAIAGIQSMQTNLSGLNSLASSVESELANIESIGKQLEDTELDDKTREGLAESLTASISTLQGLAKTDFQGYNLEDGTKKDVVMGRNGQTFSISIGGLDFANLQAIADDIKNYSDAKGAAKIGEAVAFAKDSLNGISSKISAYQQALTSAKSANTKLISVATQAMADIYGDV